MMVYSDTYESYFLFHCEELFLSQYFMFVMYEYDMHDGAKRCVCLCLQTWTKDDHTRGDVHRARLLSHREG